MSDKFEKLSIYDVDVKLEDDEGNEHNFTFKTLPFETYPEVYDLLSKFNNLDTDDDKAFMKALDKSTMKDLMKIELEMVQNSYPDMDLKKAQGFVVSNVLQLIDTLVKLTFKQEKGNPRKMDAIKNG